MKKAIVFTLFLGIVIVLWRLDYNKRKRSFDVAVAELELSLSFEEVPMLLQQYYKRHGVYPDSLGQCDTLFTSGLNWATIEDYRETPYRFLVDPFSHKYFGYIPIKDSARGTNQSFFLLSSGIDGRLDNDKSDIERLDLYDSIKFNYLDCYFGRRDILVGSGH